MAKDYTSRAAGLKAVRLDLGEDHHRKLRRLAADAEKPMSQFVRELVEKEIDRRSSRNGGGK